MKSQGTIPGYYYAQISVKTGHFWTSTTLLTIPDFSESL